MPAACSGESSCAVTRAEYPDAAAADILDCGDGSGQALAALRMGQKRLDAHRDRLLAGQAVAAIAAAESGAVLWKRVHRRSIWRARQHAPAALVAWRRDDAPPADGKQSHGMTNLIEAGEDMRARARVRATDARLV